MDGIKFGGGMVQVGNAIMTDAFFDSLVNHPDVVRRYGVAAGISHPSSSSMGPAPNQTAMNEKCRGGTPIAWRGVTAAGAVTSTGRPSPLKLGDYAVHLVQRCRRVRARALNSTAVV